jgi:hypothetical protein
LLEIVEQHEAGSLLRDFDEQCELVVHILNVGSTQHRVAITNHQFPHFGIWLPLGGNHIPKWQKKGRAAVGVFPGRPSLLT